jgi:Ca-activated chloride channel family protein
MKHPSVILSGLLLLGGLGLLGRQFVPGPITSQEQAQAKLVQELLPAIALDPAIPLADLGVATSPGAAISKRDALPSVEAFPLYGAPAVPPDREGSLRVEIVSSLEKADGERPDRRWLVDVAERFNQRRERLGGQRLEVVVRPIPSGLAAQMLAAGQLKAEAYSPASSQWVALLRQQGLQGETISHGLVDNASVIAVRGSLWRRLNPSGAISFAQVVDRTLSGQLRMAYCNPYICSPGLDFLHTLLWLSAGHSADQTPLSSADLSRATISGSFDLFQRRIAATTPTYVELINIWKRQPATFDAAVMAHQSFLRLKQEPGFDDLIAVPFGSPQSSPLVALPWTTAAQREALARFARFAASPAMRSIALAQEFNKLPRIPKEASPPEASGAVLQQAQRLWKLRKDGGRTVYLQLVIDTSGSMEEGQRLRQVKKAIGVASAAINTGNQVGLITFGDRPVRQLPLAPMDERGRQRLVATVNQLQANGSTALYDALAIGLADLMRARDKDPNGRFHLLLLSDGKPTTGLTLNQLRDVIQHSGIRITPIAYGEVDQGELQAIASVRESVVYRGTPQRILPLISDLFQTNL